MPTIKINLNKVYRDEDKDREEIGKLKKNLNKRNLPPAEVNAAQIMLEKAEEELDNRLLQSRQACESLFKRINLTQPDGAIYTSPDEVELTLTDLSVIQRVSAYALKYRLKLRAAALSPSLTMDLPLKDGYMKPWVEQTATTAFMVCNPRGYILNDTRTGKTLASIHACHVLLELNEIDCAVFVTTLSGAVSTFPREFESLYGDNNQVSYIVGDAATRTLAAKKDTKFYVTNHDALKSAHKDLAALEKRRRVAFVIDEVTAFGNHTSAVSEAAAKLTKDCKYVWGMTGTPDNPEKIFGFTKVINPELNRYHKNNFMELCYHINPNNFSKRLRMGWEDRVQQIMRPSIRIPRRDLLGPPETIDIKVPLPDSLQDIYDKFLKDSIVELEDGRTMVGDTVAILKGKLMQMANGFLNADAPPEDAIETPERYQALFDIIDKTERKVVVFASYRAILPKLRQVIYDRYPQYEVGLVNGSVTGKKRGEIMKEFTNPESNMKVLLAHPETCAHSLEFAGVSDTLVYYGAITVGSEIFSQASDRVRSRLQSSPRTFMYHIYSTEEEQLTVQATYKKVDVNFELLKHFQQVKKDVMDNLAGKNKGGLK